MREYRFAVATASSTFVLLVIGGLVHATGSSLACPDWPLCYGQLFPRMEGGVFFEHGHRLVAGTVAVLTGLMAVLVFRRRRERTVRALSVLAVGLVLVQATLGGLTVIYKLPLLVSAAHLATSMGFFSTVIYLAHRLRPMELPRAEPAPRGLVGAAALATYLQIVLGAFVRHTGAAMACGAGALCEGALWPPPGPGQLNMAHRLAGVALGVLVTFAAVRPARDALRARHGVRAVLALAAPVLVVAQLALGLLTVATYISISVVSLHLATGALLLADLLALFLSLGGQRASDATARRGAVPGLAPAAG